MKDAATVHMATAVRLHEEAALRDETYVLAKERCFGQKKILIDLSEVFFLVKICQKF